MKLLFQNYTFNAAAKKITFNTTDTVLLENVLLITNVTSNQIIYNFANPAQGGSISNNVLTLTFNTTTMSNTDSLQVFLDIGGGYAATDDSILMLRRVVQLLSPLATQDSAQRQRVVVDNIAAGTVAISSGTVSVGNAPNVTTVSTVSNVAAYAGIDPRFQFIDAARLTYAQGIRANLVTT